jgi:exodeoxyribonuclease V alpha subunit
LPIEHLQRLQQQGLISALDLHFTRFISQLAGDASPELVLAALLVSFETGNGNVCVNLPLLAGTALFNSDSEQTVLSAAERRLLQAPPWTQWSQSLYATTVVGRPGEFRPLILDRHGRLYLYRYWDYEQRLAGDLRQRAAAPVEDVDTAQLQAALAGLFAQPVPSAAAGAAQLPQQAPDWQKIAAATALLRRFCVISGGPGTGKTTTVLRILLLLLEQKHSAPPRIALAAPTGKAAARMQEAIRQAKQALAAEYDLLLQLIPEQATTIHRLLGPRNNSVYFQHNRDNPLALDVLVIDEASMVDLALMSKLTDALPQQARLILLGDKDQLASVEAGAVLGDICGPVPGFSAELCTRLQQLTGETLPPPAAGSGTGLADSILLLRRSYRFGADSGIGALARTVNQGQGGQALTVLKDTQFSDIGWHDLDPGAPLAQTLADALETGFRPYLEILRDNLQDNNIRPAQVFAAFEQFRVLCALRNGPFGVSELNRLIERILEARRWLRMRATWYPGRPVMITRNDYNLRLYNGDIGITLPDADDQGQLKVFFPGSDGQLRKLPVLRVPEHETVFAMTIHKSQGSEFDQVLLLLPPELSRVTGRELLYTGITRARRRVDIWGNQEVFKSAVERALQRSSGLRERLWPQDLSGSSKE